ncbi:MAG: hypothetical protein JO207_03805 [Verrucomicrobia bacterium]|nr:hypothetical protein [Verrucomicrobiota bacterium]
MTQISRLSTEPACARNLTGERLIPFIFEYLRRRKLEKVFSERQQVQLGERVLALLESGGQSTSVTPLLATLLVGSAISRVDAGGDLATMPDQIPEVFLDYLKRLNPTTGDATSIVSNEQLIPAAYCLAIVSLGDNFTPSDFRQQDGQSAITPSSISTPASKVIDRLIANCILGRREFAGISLLRFGLDPAAEYFAEIGYINQLQTDRNQWERFLARLKSAHIQTCAMVSWSRSAHATESISSP